MPITVGAVIDRVSQKAFSDIAFEVMGVCFRVHAAFASHLRRVCAHTSLRAIQWINMTAKHLEFITIEP